MDKRELRIGNAVKYWDSICIIEQIKIDSSQYYIYGRDSKDSHSIGNVVGAFEPIPITPGGLEKAGFVGKLSDQIGDKVEPLFILSADLILFDEGGYYRYAETSGGKLKYVHQLQNLYFALTGEELNIEL